MNLKVIVAFILCSCLSSANSEANEEDKATQSGKVFYLQLYKALNRAGNFLFSPVSVETSMYLAYDGSQGTTSDAIQRVVWPSPSQSLLDRYNNVKRILRSSEAIFSESSKIYVSNLLNLRSSYVDTVKNKFSTDVESIDFSNKEQAATIINNWVLNVTNKQITGMISKTDCVHHRYTSMLMLSCIDFSGIWNITFKRIHTKRQAFYLNDIDRIVVEMMHITQKNFDVLVDDNIDAKVLVLPFVDKHIVLTIFLPNRRDKIEDMKRKLFSSNVTVGEYMRNATKRTVNFALPKFRLESKVELKDALSNMGLEEIFSNRANFSGMIDKPDSFNNVFVDDIIQTSFFEINEIGPEAAIGTVETHFEKRVKRSADEPPIDFIVDHPFVFFVSIGDEENGFFDLFSGQVYYPEQSIQHVFHHLN